VVHGSPPAMAAVTKARPSKGASALNEKEAGLLARPPCEIVRDGFREKNWHQIGLSALGWLCSLSRH